MENTKAIFITLISVLFLGVNLSAWANLISTTNLGRTLVGKAYDAKTQVYLYAEGHVFNDDPANASMTSRYSDPSGKMIAQKVVRFERDRVTEFEFEQNEVGVARKLVRKPSSISYSSTKNNKTSNKEFALKPNKEVIVDAGLFNVVGRNWQALLDGEKIKFDLAMPDKKRTINMEIALAEMSGSTAAKVTDGDDLVLFSMNVTSRLLRVMAPTIELGYYKDTKQLAFYKGPSNLIDENGKAMRPIYVVYERAETS